MNIVFDFGGVVFAWEPQLFLQRMLPRRARDLATARVLADEFFQGFDGDWAAFDRGTIAAAALAERIARRTGLALADVRRVIDAVPDELTPVPATVELLRRLHGLGHTLYFLSNMPAPYAAHLEARHGFLDEVFRAGVYSSGVQLIKPEPAIFAHAAGAFGIAPADCLLVDDLARNVAAARDAGWRALQFADAPQCAAELAGLGALPEPR